MIFDLFPATLAPTVSSPALDNARFLMSPSPSGGGGGVTVVPAHASLTIKVNRLRCVDAQSDAAVACSDATVTQCRANMPKMKIKMKSAKMRRGWRNNIYIVVNARKAMIKKVR